MASNADREIPLTQGHSALVSQEDYEWLSQWKWFAWWNPSGRAWYAVRSVKSPHGTVRMHRQILGLEKGDHRQGDHINHDTLDNRRENLRVATPSQNTQNRRAPNNNTSGHKGVSYRPCKKKWRASIRAEGRQIHLGYRDSKQECVELYRQAEIRYFGEYACAEQKGQANVA